MVASITAINLWLLRSQHHQSKLHRACWYVYLAFQETLVSQASDTKVKASGGSALLGNSLYSALLRRNVSATSARSRCTCSCSSQESLSLIFTACSSSSRFRPAAPARGVTCGNYPCIHEGFVAHSAFLLPWSKLGAPANVGPGSLVCLYCAAFNR